MRKCVFYFPHFSRRRRLPEFLNFYIPGHPLSLTFYLLFLSFVSNYVLIIRYSNENYEWLKLHCLCNVQEISVLYIVYCGPGSSVGIATGYGLNGPGIESRRGAGFSAPVQTGRGAHPASCTMGTESFPGVKSGQGVTLTLHSLLVPWSRKTRAKPLFALWAVQPVQSRSAFTRVHFNLTFLCCLLRRKSFQQLSR